MVCPKCEHIMKQCEDDAYVYECAHCRIKYSVTKNKWEIPNCYEVATDAQKRAVLFCNSVLNTTFIPVLKQTTTKFLNEFLPRAKHEYTKPDYYDCIDESIQSLNEFLND